MLLGLGRRMGARTKYECGEVESLEHTLTEFQARTGVYGTWGMTMGMLRTAEATKEETWNFPTYEQILGVGLRTGQSKPGTRLTKIIPSETAFTIWEMKNTPRINGEAVRRERIIPPLRGRISSREWFVRKP